MEATVYPNKVFKLNIFWILEYISLVCFNQFNRPHKKLDRALSVLLYLNEIDNFGQIEEEILSKKLLKE